jgi:hypothetical protein
MSLTRMALLAGLSTTLIATGVSAQTFREHFMTNWDLNSDGAVTLEEARERRGDVFTAFDANEDGYIDAEEREAMNEMRDNEHASMAEDGIERPRGMGQGKGMGQGMGQGQGMGPGKGRGMGHGMGGGFRRNAEGGMHDGRMIDADGDGKFSRAEFVGMSERWFARLDMNGDGKINDADF